MLGGAICAQVATGDEWKAHTETVEARVVEFEALSTTKETHM